MAEPLVLLLLGAKYAALIPLLPWLALWQAMRGFKVGNTVLTLSQAQTSNAMISNGVRALALPVAWYVLANGGGVRDIIWIAMAGEFCAYCISLWLALRWTQLSIAPMLLPLAGTAAVLAAICVHVTYLAGHGTYAWVGWGAILALSIGAGLSMRELRRFLRNRGGGASAS